MDGGALTASVRYTFGCGREVCDPENFEVSSHFLTCDRTERSNMPDTLTMVRFGSVRMLFARGVFTPWLANTPLRNDNGVRLIPYAGEMPDGAA